MLPFELRRHEQVWGVYNGNLVKHRYRGSQTGFAVGVDGQVFVTTSRLLFVGPERRIEWRFDKLWNVMWQHPEAGPVCLMMSVSNRQRPSGVTVARADLAQMATMTEVAMAEHRRTRGDLVKALENDLVALLSTEPRFTTTAGAS